MLNGCFTAIVTPFAGAEVDYEGMDSLVDYQIENGITGILAVGTTGESPALSWEEHNALIKRIADRTRGRCLCIAGTGSNNTQEALLATEHARDAGADAVLLVDPYYNGPSSLEIRREYIEPIAEAFPDLTIIPYIIPGRTGAKTLPEDIALLNRKFKNVNTVKEATGDLDNMRRTRACCGDSFSILSGDDALTFAMMTDSRIGAAGVISVLSNIVPQAVSRFIAHLQAGDFEEAGRLNDKLAPLFGLVTVTTAEATPLGEVTCRARNPLALKTLMSILGLPSGGCRRPLGKMTRNGLEKVLTAARQVQNDAPEVFNPLAEWFNVDVAERLSNPAHWEGLAYEDY